VPEELQGTLPEVLHFVVGLPDSQVALAMMGSTNLKEAHHGTHCYS
jgi:hypothetical protein